MRASGSAVRLRSAGPFVLALAICVYGGILRLHALSSRYGAVQHPAWARVLTEQVAPLAHHVEPGAYTWSRVRRPYVGGDPVSYLRLAREMRSFYQGHVREPVFLAITRVFLRLVDDQDVGISFASAAMSTLAIFAAFLLGRAAFSSFVGLLAALGLAIDYDAVSWAPEGWRDDTFTCVLVLAVWALVRLRQNPRPGWAVGAGTLGAAACLTRITSVSWLLPALLLIAAGRAVDWRRRAAMAGLAALVTGALVAPYLINCALATGDPLIAINAHTVYYRASEGAPAHAPLSAVQYIARKVAGRPVAAIDTALTGLFIWPMRNKWSGFDLWVPHLAVVLETLGIIGLLLFCTTPDGRLLLVVIVTSLVPYALTWNIGGGGEWRFTMHVYPLYLIAAFCSVEWTWRTARSLPDRGLRKTVWRWGNIARAGAAAGAMILAWVGYMKLPYFIAREVLQQGEEVTIATGERDSVFYSKGWSEWRRDGAVVARVVLGERASIEFALPERRPYRLTLRVDPVTRDVPREVTLLMNGRLLQRLRLDWDPKRVGSFSVDVPVEFVRPGHTELQLVADAAIAARAAGPHYAWLPPPAPVSLRVWYVRIHPL